MKKASKPELSGTKTRSLYTIMNLRKKDQKGGREKKENDFVPDKDKIQSESFPSLPIPISTEFIKVEVGEEKESSTNHSVPNPCCVVCHHRFYSSESDILQNRLSPKVAGVGATPEDLDFNFLLESILNFPTESLEEYKNQFVTFQQRIPLCSPCLDVIKEGRQIKEQISQLEKHLLARKELILEKVKSTYDCQLSNGDHELIQKSVHSFISASLQFSSSVLIKEELEEDREQSDSVNFAYSDEDHHLYSESKSETFTKTKRKRSKLRPNSSSPFTCDECGASFKHSHSYRHHSFAQHSIILPEGSKVLSCPFNGCSYKSVIHFKIKDHLKYTHKRSDLTIAIVADSYNNENENDATKDNLTSAGPSSSKRKTVKTSTTKIKRKRTTQLNSNWYPTTPFICNSCGSSFKHYNSYRHHLLAQHSIIYPEGSKVYACSRSGCSYKSIIQAKINDHLKYAHTKEKNANKEDNLKNETELRWNSPSPFICNLCGNSVQYFSSYRHHLLAQHSIIYPEGSEVYSCSNSGCSYKSVIQSKIKGHLRYAHQHLNKAEVAVVSCEFCGKPFKTLRTLKIHQRFSHGERRNVKPFQCDICGKFFKFNGNLKLHREHHLKRAAEPPIVHEFNPAKPHPCKVCGKGFEKPSKARKHERIHQNKSSRPFN